ncbi:MAG: hypothetical protein AMJ60_11840 [Desulfobacterales bacterium SG8_35]|nr:MAG: hypothetical protein AMJ60_11840 [Desulfobacterales bacterium SG8_35]
MKRTGIKISFSILVIAFFTLIFSGFMNPSRCQALEASINISPNIINLESTSHVFGIHTNIPYSIVNVDEVILVCPEDSVLYPTVCYADSLGNLVAKFSTSDLENECELVIEDYNILVLEGETNDVPAEFFSGAGEVLIIESQPEFQKGEGPKGMQNKYGQNR